MKQRQHPIPMVVQAGLLKRAYPDSQVSLKRDRLRWIADLTPTPLSRTYRVKLEMHKDGNPEVRLVHPTLQTRDGVRCPHLYQGGVLCLYLPRAFEWTSEMHLIATIVPWISEWLAHYEVWLATGEWTGGGAHPGTESSMAQTEPATRDTRPSKVDATPKSTAAVDSGARSFVTPTSTTEARADFFGERTEVQVLEALESCNA